jgi:hypothetical protein
MTRDDLIEQMKLEGLRADMLCAETDIPSECFVIRQNGRVWETFYAERGLETGLQTFPTEDAACRDLLNEMRGYARASGQARI